MKLLRCLLAAAALSSAAHCAAAPAAGGMPDKLDIGVCSDQNEWPPFLYLERAGGVKTGRVMGYSARVLETILARNGIRHSLRLLPWSRCLAELTEGRRIQVSLDMTINAERSALFLMTRPYYTTSGHYFYSRRTYPDGLRLERLEDLGKLVVCGLKGYNYDKLKLRRIDVGANNYRALIDKLHLKRCDIFVEQYEALAGFSLIGMPMLDEPDLGHAAVPGIPPVAFSMAVSRRYRHAEALYRLLDRELAHMEAEGELKRLWKQEGGKSLPPVPDQKL